MEPGNKMNLMVKLIAAQIIEKNNGKVALASLSEFDCPSFNQDLETNSVIPTGANEKESV